LNPYAAPKAKLEQVLPGAAWRDGKLVRIDRDGALPDRCVLCNAETGRRVPRTLYWSPPAWRLLGFAVPLTFFAAGIGLRQPWLLVAFWPAAIVMAVVHYIVRRKLALEVGICAPHYRRSNRLTGVAIATLAIAVLSGFFAPDGTAIRIGLFLLAIVAFTVVPRVAGVQAVSLKRLDARYAWLASTGKAFRDALPEVPRA